MNTDLEQLLKAPMASLPNQAFIAETMAKIQRRQQQYLWSVRAIVIGFGALLFFIMSALSPNADYILSLLESVTALIPSLAILPNINLNPSIPVKSFFPYIIASGAAAMFYFAIQLVEKP